MSNGWAAYAIAAGASIGATEVLGVYLSQRFNADIKDYSLKSMVMMGAYALFQVSRTFIAPRPVRARPMMYCPCAAAHALQQRERSASAHGCAKNWDCTVGCDHCSSNLENAVERLAR